MIGASEGLYNYFNQNIREEGQEIEIKITKGAKSYTITDDDLVASSVKITKKSVSGASFDIGECYVDSATFTINKNINNYKSLTGAKVTIRIKVNNTDLSLSENVLLGTFRILQDGIKRTNTLLQVTADSYISKFDKSRKRATFTGDLYDLVMDSCNKCKVTFGMTESAFRALSPNVAKTYEIKKDSSLKTHRDVIMYVAQLIGGFATTTPSGALIFKNYTSNNDVCNVNDNVIVNYSIGDEVYNLSGLGMSVKEKDVYLYREGEDDDSPYFLNLDTNPIMENCTDDEITAIVGNIWTKLIELNLNNFSFEFNGNPLIEVGDIISIPERSLETYVASYEWTYHGKEKISCVSVDKNKRTETQRDKQNENKPSNASKDDRVDDLIKNTTTKTRKIKKTVESTFRVDNYESREEIFYGNNSNGINIFTEKKQLSYTLPSGDTIKYPIDSVKLQLIFYYPALKLNISDIITRLPSTTKDNDIITLDFKDIKGFVFLGYVGRKYGGDGSVVFNIKPYTGHKEYSIMNYDMTEIVRNASMSVNYFDSISDAIFYETDAFGNFIGNIPNFNVSTSGITVLKDVGESSSQTEEYGIDASFNFNFQNVLDANGINYESIENNILSIKYKDLKYIRDTLNSTLLDTAKFKGSNEFYKSLIKYSDTYYNRTKSDTLDSFSNTISQGGTLFSYCDIEQNVDAQNKYDNIFAYDRYFDIDVTYKEETEESYTTTIEGTSNKINENADKTDKNADDIEQLKTDVKKNKANIDKLKQQVTSVSNKVGAMSNSLGAAKTDIAKLDIRVTKLESSGGSSGGGMTDAQKKQLEQNTKDISTLKTNVSNNTKNISTNATNITRLTTRVTNLENSGGSGGSGSSITEAERQQIQTNKTDISNLTTRVTNLENSGGSGGSGITEAERQQIQTNKQNIENLTLTVNGHTTSIEDILRRLTQLEQGSGGDTGDAFKFIKLELIFKDSDNSSSYAKNDYDFTKYFINGSYYFSSDGYTYYRLKATLNKTGTKQTFRNTFRTDGTQYYMIGNADTTDLESSTVRFSSTGKEYLDCISKLDDQQIISPQIKVIQYKKVSAKSYNRDWKNETTGQTVYTEGGAHIGDIISVPLTVNNGFKALSINNKPEELNKYWYAITTSNSNKKGVITNWTELNAEPNIATNITFTYDESLANKSVYVHITDGQFTTYAAYLYIKKLT